MLSNADHWTQITGKTVREFYEWETSFDEEYILSVYRRQQELLPFDMMQPYVVPDVRTRREGRAVIPESIHEAGSGGGVNETCYVFNKEDAKRVITPKPAGRIIAEGIHDHAKLLVREFGADNFIVTGGVVNCFYANVYHMGMQTFLERLVTEPELIHYCNSLTLEQNYEIIDAYGEIGGDAVYIDDALSTSEMISLKMYEEFSLPTMKKLAEAIHAKGMKAIIIYFGGIDDRVEQIASIGADLLFMETRMKTYRNDYAEVARRLGGGMCLAGNLNPYNDIEITYGEELRRRMSVMSKAGREYGRYVISTGSPLTPNTTLDRMQEYIRLGREL